MQLMIMCMYVGSIMHILHSPNMKSITTISIPILSISTSYICHASILKYG